MIIVSYPSDLTDAEWVPAEPLIPPAKHGGNRRHVDMRKVVNGLMYVFGMGCHGAILKEPKDRSNVAGRARRQVWDRTLEHIHEALYVGLEALLFRSDARGGSAPAEPWTPVRRALATNSKRTVQLAGDCTSRNAGRVSGGQGHAGTSQIGHPLIIEDTLVQKLRFWLIAADALAALVKATASVSRL